MPATSADAPHQWLRFLAGGAANTAASYALFWLLVGVVHRQLAYALAFACGIVLAYFLNSRWVFRSAPGRAAALSYPLLYLAVYLCNAGLLELGVRALGWSPRGSLAAALLLSTPLSFFLNRRWLAAPAARR
ncbi:MAG: GtrA family protein [Lysobacteraceae bacterium]